MASILYDYVKMKSRRLPALKPHQSDLAQEKVNELQRIGQAAPKTQRDVAAQQFREAYRLADQTPSGFTELLT